eukprot:Stramenopile-MAST_4_protein_3064
MAFPRPKATKAFGPGPEIGNLARVGGVPRVPVLKKPKSTLEKARRQRLSPLHHQGSNALGGSIIFDNTGHGLVENTGVSGAESSAFLLPTGSGDVDSGGSALSMTQFDRLGGSSSSVRVIARERDDAVKMRQSLSKQLSIVSKQKDSHSQEIKSLRFAKDELEDSAQSYKRIIAQQQTAIHRLQQRFDIVNKTLASFPREEHVVKHVENAHPAVLRRREERAVKEKQRLLSVTTEGNEVREATASTATSSRHSSRSGGSNDRLFKNAISTLAREKQSVEEELHRLQAKHRALKELHKKEADENRKLKRKMHIFDGSKKTSVLQPDNKSAISRSTEAAVVAGKTTNAADESVNANAGQIESLLNSMLSSAGEEVTHRDKHLINTIRHMETLFEVVTDLTAMTSIKDIMTTLELRVSRLLSCDRIT